VFDAQVAQTFEVGAKSFFMDRRISASLALYRTDFDNAYFFLFDPGTSTQNLGTIDEVTYSGLELEANALISDSLSAYIGIGITDSEINKAADPSHVGNQAPLVSETTMNIGATYRRNTGLFGGAADFIGRFDYQYTGETWWEPGNVTSRSPVTVVDFRVGFEAEDDWSLMLWSKNAFDEEYNTEFSPGPAPGYNFHWKALPNRWGVEFMKRF
jgi:iron complex outermembrane receptor protein